MLQFKFINLLFFTYLGLSLGGGVFLNTASATELKKTDKALLDKAAKDEVIGKMLFIPRIKLIEKNSLKSYNWWEKEDPKIPSLYKLILNKIKDDFLLEKIEVEYVVKKLTKSNMSDFESHYVIFGTLILDSINKADHQLKDLSFYKIENGQLKIVMISNTEIQDVNSNFRSTAVSLKEKIAGVVSSTQPLEGPKPEAKKTHLVIFENELSYEELNQIRVSIKDNLKIDMNDVKLLYSETKKYTFQININESPFESLKKMTFVNGPYETEMVEEALVFKPYSEEDFL